MEVPFLSGLEPIKQKINGMIGLRFPPRPVLIAGIAMLVLVFLIAPAPVSEALSLALFLAPVWVPFILVRGATELWYNWKRSEFVSNQEYVLLEIKPPRNIDKTPLAMETFLSALHLTGSESTWWQRFQGGTRPYFSLEIASFEGQIHFFIWSRAPLRRLIESQLYAQYPGIQVVEATDYTRLITAEPPEWGVWGCAFNHTSAAPLPIKTYVEYGLNETNLKEFQQVDPFASLIEFLASIGKGEQIWLQYIIRAHKGEIYGADPGGNESNKLNAEGKPYTWKDEAKELVEKIRAGTVKKVAYTDVFTGEKRETEGFPNPTKGESEKMAAIERNVSKLAFDVAIRGVYVAKQEKFHVPMIVHLIALFKPFTTENWNGINSTAWLKFFNDFPWEFGAEKRKVRYRKELIEAYRRRQYYYEPRFEGELALKNTMVMSTEELATVYHIPSRAIETPGVGRVASATGEAPKNLPT